MHAADRQLVACAKSECEVIGREENRCFTDDPDIY